MPNSEAEKDEGAGAAARDKLDDTSLRMVLDFKPELSAFEKAHAAFEAFLSFRALVEAITDEVVGARDRIKWSVSRVAFDGADIDAQPFYDALMNAYEKGQRAGIRALDAAPSPAPTDTKEGAHG